MIIKVWSIIGVQWNSVRATCCLGVKHLFVQNLHQIPRVCMSACVKVQLEAFVNC
jgi:hypothetical protein